MSRGLRLSVAILMGLEGQARRPGRLGGATGILSGCATHEPHMVYKE